MAIEDPASARLAPTEILWRLFLGLVVTALAFPVALHVHPPPVNGLLFLLLEAGIHAAWFCKSDEAETLGAACPRVRADVRVHHFTIPLEVSLKGFFVCGLGEAAHENGAANVLLTAYSPAGGGDGAPSLVASAASLDLRSCRDGALLSPLREPGRTSILLHRRVQLLDHGEDLLPRAGHRDQLVVVVNLAGDVNRRSRGFPERANPVTLRSDHRSCSGLGQGTPEEELARRVQELTWSSVPPVLVVGASHDLLDDESHSVEDEVWALGEDGEDPEARLRVVVAARGKLEVRVGPPLDIVHHGAVVAHDLGH
mmetsp:Transcript_3600/g.8478  ORF Transcript_3600/g.8478 Transcript_3600/m.8478 type:complete len:312 (-) Transcript_3600:142-1077(-)